MEDLKEIKLKEVPVMIPEYLYESCNLGSDRVG